MALDGIAIANVKEELNKQLLGGRIDKVYQPLSDELAFTVRSIGANFRVLLSANPSHPRAHITNMNKNNPMTPSLFCMVLRKYIAGGKLVSIEQPNFERILIFTIDSSNELGDITSKKLIIEIMGKHSNIILTDENNKILDSIKRISHDKSSVREVLPGRDYVYPPSQNKKNPLFLSKEEFLELIKIQDGQKLQELIYKNYTGISPIMASEICYNAKLNSSMTTMELTDNEKESLFSSFLDTMTKTAHGEFSPELVYDNHKLIDFSSIKMNQLENFEKKEFSSISELLENYYTERDNTYHILQKSHDIRRIVLSNIDRCMKKQEIQEKTLKDTKGKELWKKKGELLIANIYAVQKGMTTFETTDFYEESLPQIIISIDPTKTPSENAARYFNKYNKAKRTLVALKPQMEQNIEELNYLESVLNGLDTAKDEADISEIKEELINAGFIKKKFNKKGKEQKTKKSKPMHYISSDGYDIYVGKSNIQNDELTLKFADSEDIWLHTKDIPGSHVIIRTKLNEELLDTTLLEAANLAAYYSKGKNSSSVPVDYVIRKHVKKPSGAKPGLVIYEKNKTLYITPSEAMVLNMKN